MRSSQTLLALQGIVTVCRSCRFQAHTLFLQRQSHRQQNIRLAIDRMHEHRMSCCLEMLDMFPSTINIVKIAALLFSDDAPSCTRFLRVFKNECCEAVEWV